MRIDLKLTNLPARSVAIGGFLVVIALFAFSLLTLVGNAVARGADNPAAAEFAAWVAPGEPFAYFVSGFYLERSMRPEDLPRSLEMFEKAAALEPNDWFLWLEYGKALERNGKPAEAEKALRHAASVAPNYSEVLWTLGNLLIRNGEDEEGFAQIRKAVEGNKQFAAPAASLAWDIFRGDIPKVTEAVGDSNAVKAAMAGFLAKQEKFDDALKLWNSIPEGEKRTRHAEAGQQLVQSLLDSKRLAEAVELQSQLSDRSPKLATVTNGGFEEDVVTEKPGPLEWKIAEGKNPAVGISVEQRRDGAKSLALIFESRSTGGFRNISQMVAVRPGVEYRFEAFIKTDLKADKTMLWEIADAATGEVIASTPAVSASSGWSPASVDFRTEDGSEGVIVRLVREPCLGSECSISGSAWIDAISIRPVEENKQGGQDK